MIRALLPAGLLVTSNVFMTFAWYSHLKWGRHSALWQVVLLSWLIALGEYWFQVPANRIGSHYFSTTQLKIMQEAITLTVFCVFAVFYMREHLRWNYIVGMCLMLTAVFFVFKKW